MLLKHANQYDLYSIKVFFSVELADIGSDVLNDRQRSGTSETLKTNAFKSLLDENHSQTRKGLAKQLGVIQTTSMQNCLAEQRFRDVAEVREWIDDFIESKPMSFFHEGIRKLLDRWQKVIESEGKYFDD
uniref:HTH_48 domain-containing protein n=1 Tax=Heterorhabditis bacteriophora TaxID=37862 RepID=A0A1I7XA33_HETBA